MIAFFTLQAQEKKAYQLYTSNGVPVTYSEMLNGIQASDIVFFGELHNNPISHWLQLELTSDLFKEKQGDLILSAEMFESDNQLILDEYLEGIIPRSRFEAECRLWPNYQTDYKPLVEFANENELEFIAANVPRRYANIVSKKGFEVLETLSPDAKSLLPPLPIEYDPTVPCYKNMLEMEGMPAHVSENLPKAQALKDATMAHFIFKSYKTGKQIIHYNGAYHSNNHEGTVWYINQYFPKLNVKVISTAEQEDIYNLDEDNLGIGDYILVIPENMTKTY
jgi:uncharacterized iron-regulated protein